MTAPAPERPLPPDPALPEPGPDVPVPPDPVLPEPGPDVPVPVEPTPESDPEPLIPSGLEAGPDQGGGEDG